MLNFKVDTSTCINCGLCASDCPAKIIVMGDNGPAIATADEGRCYRCQHCLAICPKGAVSILGVLPSACAPLEGNLPSADQVEILIRGRRTVRRYQDENLDPALIARLLNVAWQGASARNERKVLLTVIDDRKVMEAFRAETLGALGRMIRDNKLPPGRERFIDIVAAWENKKIDIIFRGAPHLVVASAPKTCATPEADCLIALTTFELFASSLGVGTVWSGMLQWVMLEIWPALRGKLGIPEDHVIGFSMVFGKPAVKYTRTVRHEPAWIARVH